jgi:hypothetical protein
MSSTSPTPKLSLWRQATGTASLSSCSAVEVAYRAYLIYLSRLPGQGTDMQDWLEAERQLREEKLAPPDAGS